jgi:phosphatidate cytidylyltransferase
MNALHDHEVVYLLGALVIALIVATVLGQLLRIPMRKSQSSRRTIDNVNARIRGWWIMVILVSLAITSGAAGALILFAIVSLLALREFVTLMPSSTSDHRSLIWAFFIITPIQYLLVAYDQYQWFSVAIPIYGFAIIATRNATIGDTDRYLERTATLQWAILSCVYCVSFMPALLKLDIPDMGSEVKLLIFLATVSQLSDVFQYIWGKTMGKHLIAPNVSPNKTVEGFVGGVVCATLVGAGMWWATPFNPWQAACMALLITLLGFAGGLVMSAIKRDRGVKDYGAMIEGHGGVLDHIDSLIFAAPVFYVLTRQLFG